MDFDTGLVWEHAQDVNDPNPKHAYAQTNPGKMLAEYVKMIEKILY